MLPQAICIPKFGKISVKFSVLGILYHYHCTDGVKIGTEECIPSHQISPISAMCRPCGAKNLKIAL